MARAERRETAAALDSKRFDTRRVLQRDANARAVGRLDHFDERVFHDDRTLVHPATASLPAAVGDVAVAAREVREVLHALRKLGVTGGGRHADHELDAAIDV